MKNLINRLESMVGESSNGGVGDELSERFQAPTNRDASGWKKMFGSVFSDASKGKRLQYLVVDVKVQLPDQSYQQFKVSGSVLRIANFLSDRNQDGSLVMADVIMATDDRNLARKMAEEV